MSKYLVTIATVTYNSEKYLEQCIKSVLKQDFDSYEYIIIDGKSSDKTLTIVDKYKGGISQIISERDFGAYDAMNKAIDIARGEYILFLNSDDYFIDEQSLSNLYDCMIRGCKKWASGLIEVLDSHNNIISKDCYRHYNLNSMLIKNIFRHPASLMPVGWLRMHKFDLKYKYAADYDIALKFWEEFGAPTFVNHYISRFRIDGESLSSNVYCSLMDENRVRKEYRVRNKESLLILYDYLVLILRLLNYSIKKYIKKWKK